MKKMKIMYSLIGMSVVAAIILASCNSAAPTATATAAPVIPTSTPVPVMPTAMATIAPVATNTPVPQATATQPPTLAATPTTEQLTAQVIPSINAYCRKGPGTGYFEITYLTNGTTYNVVGRNSLNTWWQVQAPGNVTCWEGDPNGTTQGPVQQVPIVFVPPLPLTPSLFVETNTCNTTLNTLTVSFNWASVQNVTGYRIYRNGTLWTTVGPTVNAYEDSSAPLGVNILYELEAFNDYGVAPRISTTVGACE